MLKEFYTEGAIEAGCDEAGRGCLAGPVFAAAVVLPAGFGHPLLDDSKKMTARNRNILRSIIEREALAWAVESVSAERIDEINILNASFEAMSLAVGKLMSMGKLMSGETVVEASGEASGTSDKASGALGEAVLPEMLLIDGNRFRTTFDIPYRCIVGGDGKYASIAAASVLAKTHRDELMERLAEEFPHYGWMRNKGYPTRSHREAILRHGLSPHHRGTFTCIRDADATRR